MVENFFPHIFIFSGYFAKAKLVMVPLMTLQRKSGESPNEIRDALTKFRRVFECTISVNYNIKLKINESNKLITWGLNIGTQA